MFNFKKFAQDPNDFIEYFKTNLVVPLSDAQAATFYNNVKNTFTKESFRNFCRETVLFVANHDLNPEVVRIVLGRNLDNYQFLEKYLSFVNSGGQPNILGSGSLEEIQNKINLKSRGINIIDDVIIKIFSKLLSSDLTEEQIFVLNNLATMVKGQAFNILRLIVNSPHTNDEIMLLLSNLYHLINKIGHVPQYFLELNQNDQNTNSIIEFLISDIDTQVQVYNELDRYLNLHHLNAHIKQSFISYVLKNKISSQENFSFLKRELLSISDSLDPQYFEIPFEYISDFTTPRCDSFLLQHALKKITGQDDNKIHKEFFSKQHNNFEVYDYVSQINPAYYEFNEAIKNDVMARSTAIPSYLDMISIFDLKDLNILARLGNISKIITLHHQKQPSSVINKVLNELKFQSTSLNDIKSYLLRIRHDTDEYNKILKSILYHITKENWWHYTYNKLNANKLEPLRNPENEEQQNEDLIKKIKGSFFLKKMNADLDESVDLLGLVDHVEKIMLDEPDLYRTRKDDNDSFSAYAEFYSIFGKEFPQNILRSLDFNKKLNLHLNLGQIENDENKKYVEVALRSKWTNLTGMALARSFVIEEGDINLDETNPNFISPNEKIKSIVENGQLENLTPAELIAFMKDFNGDEERFQKFISDINRVYRNVVKGSDEYEKIILTLSSCGHKMNDIFGISSRLLIEMFDKSEITDNGVFSYLNKCWMIYNIFGKRSRDWISKFENLHDALQPLKPYTKEQAQGLGEFILNSKINLQRMKLIISKWPHLTEIQKNYDATKLYNELFLDNIKNLSSAYDPKDTDFLLEYAQAYTDSESDDDPFSSEEPVDAFARSKFIKDSDGNELKIDYGVIEDVYINSQEVPLPSWADAYYEVEENKKTYIARFLKRSDTRGLLLGNYTNCCQHPFAEGATSAFYGQSQPNSAFLIVHYKNSKDIICQSWAWESKTKDGKSKCVCFDNVEALGLGDRNDIVSQCYEEIAKQISKKGYNVTIGTEGSDLDLDPYTEASSSTAGVPPETIDFSLIGKPGKYNVYTDARIQVLLSSAE